jgi:hypothetical protein
MYTVCRWIEVARSDVVLILVSTNMFKVACSRSEVIADQKRV